jgi:hypothetical protein
MRISEPYHDEIKSQDICYVLDDDGINTLTTLAVGQRYETAEGAIYSLDEIHPASKTVVVSRNGEWFVWRVESLVNAHMRLIGEREVL